MIFACIYIIRLINGLFIKFSLNIEQSRVKYIYAKKQRKLSKTAFKKN